jgi:rhomboid protease GluP
MADFTKAVELAPDRAEGWLARARLLAVLGDPEAIACYARAAELAPADAAVLIERSGHLINSKKVAQALQDAESATTRAPQSPEGWTAKGRARLSKQDAKGSRADFDKALELDPGFLPALFWKARSRAWEEPSAARQEFARLAAITPVRPADFYYRGLAGEVTGNAAQAKEDFAKAIEAIPIWSPDRDDIEKRVPLPGSHTSPVRKVAAAPVTTFLLFTCLVTMMVAEGAGSTLQTETLIRFGALERGHVWSGEYWRLFTAMFLHVGWVHFIWNSFVMFGLCGGVERLLGPGRFMAGYLLTGVLASALSLVGANHVAAGASGAGFGMLGILLGGAYLKLGGMAPFLRHRGVFGTLKWMAIWFGLGMTVLPFDNWAHLGGLLSGIAAGMLWLAGPRMSRAARASGWTAVGAAVALLVAASLHPWPFLYPDFKGWPAFSAGVDAMQKDPAAAEGHFDRAVQQGFRSESLHLNRGLTRQAQGRFGPAIDDFGAAIALNPKGADAFYLRGVCRAAVGKNQEALGDLNVATSLDKTRYEAWAAKGRLLIQIGDVNGAIADYQKALREAPPGWEQRGEIEKWLKEKGR